MIRRRFDRKTKAEPCRSAREKVQADIESMASQTKDRDPKNMYFTQSKELENMIKKLNPYL